MSLVNARAAFETAILDAVTDADPTVSVIFDNMPLKFQISKLIWLKF